MLVCRHWRNVALASPTLWRVIDAAFKTSWTALLLARSCPATIDFTFGIRGFSPGKTLRALLPHSSRLRSLKFSRIQAVWRPAAVSFVRSVAGFPSLEVLEFPVASTRPDPGEVLDNLADIGLSFQRFPSLHSLLLHFTIAPQDPLLCAGLRKLSLTHCI